MMNEQEWKWLLSHMEFIDKSQVLRNIFRPYVRSGHVGVHVLCRCHGPVITMQMCPVRKLVLTCYMTLNLAMDNPFGSASSSRFLHVLNFCFHLFLHQILVHVVLDARDAERKESDGRSAVLFDAINENISSQRTLA